MKKESCRAIIAVGPHNTCLILFAHGSMLECEVSEMSPHPDDIEFEVPSGLGCGIHVWEGVGVYTPDAEFGDGGDCLYNCISVRGLTEHELGEVLKLESPWSKLWDTTIQKEKS